MNLWFIKCHLLLHAVSILEKLFFFRFIHLSVTFYISSLLSCFIFIIQQNDYIMKFFYAQIFSVPRRLIVNYKISFVFPIFSLTKNNDDVHFNISRWEKNEKTKEMEVEKQCYRLPPSADRLNLIYRKFSVNKKSDATLSSKSLSTLNANHLIERKSIEENAKKKIVWDLLVFV